MEVVQAVCVATVLGGLIAAWAILHFHGQYRPQDIRFSVPQQRYWVALFMHVCAIAAIYAILIYAFYPLVLAITYGDESSHCWICTVDRLPCPEACTNMQPFEPGSLVWAALASAVLVRLVMPALPITRTMLEQLRHLLHGLTLFPAARESLVASLTTQRFTAQEDAETELGEELKLYGVAPESMKFLSLSARRTLVEVCAVRGRLLRLSERTHAFDPSLWTRILAVKEVLFPPDPRSAHHDGSTKRHLSLFWRARADTLTQLEADFRRLLRRSARALLLAEDIDEKVQDQVLCRAVSNFVAEESEALLAQYRSIVAEAALACEPHREDRTNFLKFFGYAVSAPPSLPLRPWVIVFVLDFLLFLIPSLLFPFTNPVPAASSGAAPLAPAHIPVAPFVLFACVHAIAQTVAITWAIYPKIASNFARPSPDTLPWQSYIVYGAASVVSGAILLFIFRLNIPMSFPIVLPTLLNSLSFALMTVGVSWRIDLWLQSPPRDFRRQRLLDGATIALLSLAGTAMFQAVMFHLAPSIEWVDSNLRAPWVIRASFLSLSTTLGFIIGYFVPSAAAGYLEHASLRGSDLLDRDGLVHALAAATEDWKGSPSAQASVQA